MMLFKEYKHKVVRNSTIYIRNSTMYIRNSTMYIRNSTMYIRNSTMYIRNNETTKSWICMKCIGPNSVKMNKINIEQVYLNS